MKRLWNSVFVNGDRGSLVKNVGLHSTYIHYGWKTILFSITFSVLTINGYKFSNKIVRIWRVFASPLLAQGKQWIFCDTFSDSGVHSNNWYMIRSILNTTFNDIPVRTCRYQSLLRQIETRFCAGIHSWPWIWPLRSFQSRMDFF